MKQSLTLFALLALVGCGSANATTTSVTNTASTESAGGSATPPATTASTPTAGEVGSTLPEFGSQESNRWLGGQPFTLASARGNVVIVESWHRL